MKKVILAINFVLFSSVLGMENRDLEWEWSGESDSEIRELMGWSDASDGEIEPNREWSKVDENIRNRLWFEAAEEGNLARIDSMIRGGVNPDIRDWNKNTALIVAAKRNNLEVVEHLLEFRNPTETEVLGFVNAWKNIKYHNASDQKLRQLIDHCRRLVDIDAKGSADTTALIIAAEKGNEKIMQLLIDVGADVNAQDVYGRTALINAMLKGSKEMVQLLLDKGADVNVEDREGRTALMRAVWKEEGMVQPLLDKGADVNATDKDGKTALMEAAEKGNEKIMQLLLDKGADVDAKDRYDRKTALMRAVKGGYEDIERYEDEEGYERRVWGEYERRGYGNREEYDSIVRLLIDKGADVNAKDNDGSTALMEAIENGNEEMVQLLLDHGADVNARNENGRTALMIAVEVKNEGMVQLLLDKGADVNARDNNDSTALMEAVVMGRNEGVVQLLINRGANVNDLNIMKNRVRLMGALVECENLVRPLTNAGFYIKKEDLQQAREWARSLRSEETLGSLEAAYDDQCQHYKNTDVCADLVEATKNGSRGLVEELLINRGNIDANEREEALRIAMMEATEDAEHRVRIYEEIADLLIDAGADVNVRFLKRRNKNYIHKTETMLLIDAVQNINVERVRKLIEHGADVNARNENGRTALMIAAWRDEGIVQILIDKGADVNAKDNDGSTALMIAVEVKNEGMVQLLLDNGADVNARGRSG